MSTEQAQWAAQLRELPMIFRKALHSADDRVIRHRPGDGEWSAIEVLGHMIDKMTHWSDRVERIAREERPTLPGYDQDAEVRDHAYQQADPARLFEHLQQQCERFAALVVMLPSSALSREGVHEEYGLMTIQQCIQAPLESVAAHLEQLLAAQQAASGASEQE
jgi:DinB family protein